MKKILFLIHDLSVGGAEKVLVNLVNNMDKEKFDITVMTLFDVGVNKQFLSPYIKYSTCFTKMIRGNSHLMKLLPPQQLHKWLIKEHYDVEVAYLEGPCARIISGCPHGDTKLVSWIHIEQKTQKRVAVAFRTKEEAALCYNRFHQIIAVSQAVANDFMSLLPIKGPVSVLYNTNETEQILLLSNEETEIVFRKDRVNLVGVGKLLPKKGFDRILRIQKKLIDEGYSIHLYILGVGPMKEELEKYVEENKLKKYVTFLGYQTNPYKYVAKCDLFVCASYAEGFSTAATEALIVGTPVCTVEVSGMKEMLGENNEYGVVTENDEESLYQGIKELISNSRKLTYYKKQAEIRGKDFSKDKTVQAVEKMLLELCE